MTTNKILLLICLGSLWKNSQEFKYSNGRPAIVREIVNPHKREIQRNFELEVKTGSESFKLNLKRTSDIFTENFKSYGLNTDKRGKPETREIKHTKELDTRKLFTDDKTGASLYIEDGEKPGEILLEGLITEDYWIVPNPGSNDYYDIEIDYVVEGNLTNSTHTVYEVIVEVEEQGDQDKDVHDNLIEIPALKPIMAFAKDKRNDDFTGNKAATPPDIYPEILVMLDYNKTRYFNGDVEAVKRYLAIFYNAVNLRFKTVKTMNIRVAICGVYLTLSKESEPYVQEEFPYAIGHEKTLKRLSHWMHNDGYNMTPEFDMAVWMTGLDIGDYDKDGKWGSSVRGIAYVCGGCRVNSSTNKTLSIAVVEERGGTYTGIWPAAHEIGHLLGATHDGSGGPFESEGQPSAVNCSWDDGYLMSYLAGRNRFYFSECSIRQMEWYAPMAVCLHDVPKIAKFQLNSTLPGLFISLDEQCKYFYGPNATQYDYGRKYNVSVCEFLICKVDGQMWGKDMALEGSLCDKSGKRRCNRGECRDFNNGEW